MMILMGPLYLLSLDQLPTTRIVWYNRLHHQVSRVICYTLQTNIITGELVEGEISTSKVFQHFYAKLVKMLPMDDALFIAELFSANLLPGDVKDQVKSMSTSADKATHLLDHVIQPSVMTGVGSSYDDLIKVMENSEYDGVKELGGIIRSKLKNPLKNVEAGELNFYSKFVNLFFFFETCVTSSTQKCQTLFLSLLAVAYT